MWHKPNNEGMKKVTESIRIEDSVKTDLVKIGGEFQQKLGKPFTFSDTINQLIKEHRTKEA